MALPSDGPGHIMPARKLDFYYLYRRHAGSGLRARRPTGRTDLCWRCGELRRVGTKRSRFLSRFWLLALVMAAAIVLAACGGGAGQQQGDDDETGAADGEPIKIGVLSPFSGPFASVGKLKVDIFNLLLADVNEAGGINGRPVTFVAGDSQGTANEARNQALRLIDQEQVDLLVGAY